MVRSGQFFFAIFSLFRFSISLGLLERPLCVALFWGLITGEYACSLAIAVFFELCWLDVIPVGTFIPPHIAASTVAALSLSMHMGLEGPYGGLLAIISAMPLAWFGIRIEHYVRMFQNTQYNRLLIWTRKFDGRDYPKYLIYRSLALTFIAFGLFFWISMLILDPLVTLVMPYVMPHLEKLTIDWPHIWLAASIGGVMALRLKRAYALLMVSVALVAISGGLQLF